MGISTQRVKLDIGKQASMQVIRLGQGDRNGTTLVAELYDGGSPYSLSGKTARFTMRTPDGRSSYSVNSSSISNNTATFNIDERYAAGVAGTTDVAYIEVLSGSTVICSTSRMGVICLQSATEGVSPSQMHDNGLDAAIAAANAATAEVNEAMSDISEFAVPLMSADTRGGAKLGSGLAVSDGVLSVSPIPDASIDSVASGDSQTGAQSLSLTGLSRLLAKMRAAFAAISHVHSADDVTSGTLPVARGGTSGTTPADARAALGAAPASHVHSADDVTSGTLPVARGGTGVTTAAAERERLGLGSTTGALPVAHGGTGATTASDARTNLSVYSKAEVDDEIAGIGIVTGTSTVSNGVWEWVKLPGGIAIAHYRDTSDRTVDITNASGSIYWAAINSLAFPFTFAHQPSVSVSASGVSNFFTWASNVTTTATGQIYVGRGTLASGVNTRLFITVTGIYS